MINIYIKYDSVNNKYCLECEGLGKVSLKTSVGAKCLYLLINNEGRSFTPVLLRSIIANNGDITLSSQQGTGSYDKEERYLYLALNPYIEAMDRKGIKNILTEMRRYEQELVVARENNDLAKIDELISDKEFCEDYLKDILNKNGSIKNLNLNNRNATKSIQRGITEALQEICFQSPELYKILKNCVVKTSNQIKFVAWGDEPLIV